MLQVEFADDVTRRRFVGGRPVGFRLGDGASHRGLRTHRRLQVGGAGWRRWLDRLAGVPAV